MTTIHLTTQDYEVIESGDKDGLKRHVNELRGEINRLNGNDTTRRRFTCLRCGKFVEAEVSHQGWAICPACENDVMVKP